jgi:hypothetical protein
MPNYALVVVPPDWEPDRTIGFSHATYEQWRDKIEPGMRVLIYKGTPVNAIVAEGESHGVFAKLADWPEVNVKEPPKTASGERAAYVMPLRVLYMRAEANRIPLEQVKARMSDPAFPNVEILPVEEDDYHILTNWP